MMLKHRLILLFMIQLILFSHSSKSQESPKKINREAVVSGSFYPSSPVKLTSMLEDLFALASPKETQNTFAIISPHAGYIYSGAIAASAFNQIDSNKKYKTIFIIGSSHRFSFEGASIYDKGNFKTPFGEVEADIETAENIIKSDTVFQFNADYHIPDHCIEVQLPFLQYYLKNDFKIVPILIGTNNLTICKKIADGLKEYLSSDHLFVISTDFSHYPSYEDALIIDKNTADAIIKNDVEVFSKNCKIYNLSNTTNLQTPICGLSAVISFLHITETLKDIEIKQIRYSNSGDVSQDSSAVVGYWAMAFSSDSICKKGESNSEFSLTQKDKKDLLHIARETLENYIKTGKRPTIDTSNFSPTIKQNCGAFVTLKINENLRGCIGRFNPEEPLYKIIQEMTISSATQDYRFKPVNKSELNDITIEISVLSPLKKINSPEDFILGKHGIYMTKGNSSGTFLPQVADETGWTKEEFLGHCAQDKAGIGWDGWKQATLYVYTAIILGEEEK